jgi:hypothetical protein
VHKRGKAVRALQGLRLAGSEQFPQDAPQIVRGDCLLPLLLPATHPHHPSSPTQPPCQSDLLAKCDHLTLRVKHALTSPDQAAVSPPKIRENTSTDC